MKSKNLVIIKLGGSIVTYKNSAVPRARIDSITRLAKEIKSLREKYQLILVHGAGSFAHPLVKKYKLHLGMKTKEQKFAFTKTCTQMLLLNSLVVGALLKNKVPAITLPPHAFITQSAGKLNAFDTGLIKKYLDNEQVPVLSGDLVLDDTWGCSVLSGDTIVCYLAKNFKADKVIFLSDVDGIFDCDPKKNPKAKRIPLVDNQNLGEVLKCLTQNNLNDVTGEMDKKVKEIKKYLFNIPTFIINGLSPNSLTKVLKGQDVGTELLFDDKH